MAITQLMTVEDLEEMGDEGAYRELIEGVLQEQMAGGILHSRGGTRIGGHLGAFVHEHNLGEAFILQIGFVIDPDRQTVLIPDVAFLSNERLAQIEDEERIARVIPDLVIEVLSPNDRTSEVLAKVSRYLQAGVRLVWVVNPRSLTTTVYRPDGEPETVSPDRALDGEDVVPGYQLRLADLFV